MIFPMFLNIKKDMINQRIDNFLIKTLKKIPKDMIYRIIRIGKIRINKKRVKPYYKLKLGDIIRLPPLKCSKNFNEKSFVSLKFFQLLIKNILYEDKYLLVINKPSGIAVHGGSGSNFGIIEVFRKLFPLNTNIELVHRLDKDTSGILLLSKKTSILRELHKQLREKKIEKNYIALVHGHWPKKITKVDFPLFKNEARKVSVNIKGKTSETLFKIIRNFSSTTLVNVKPITGRTHQIRVHALSIGHPVVFDNRYGNTLLDKNLYIEQSNLLLHANSIKFTHPHNNKKIFIHAPLEEKFKKCLHKLKQCP